MRRALLLAFLVALPLASGDDKKKDSAFRWDPRQQPRAVAGTRTFYDYSSSEAVQMALGSKGSMTQITSRTAVTASYRWTRHVLFVESGEINEAAAKIERWRRESWGEKDTSLEGKSIALARKAGKLEATIEDPEGVSAAAREWLEGEVFRRGGRPTDSEFVEDLLLVREPALVTTGCAWTRDPKAVALGLLRTTDLDLQRSSVEGKLEDVHLVRGVRYGKASVKAVLQVRKLDMSEMRFEDGALVELAWTYEGSLELARREEGERTLTWTIEGRSKYGSSLEAQTRSERTETVKCGPARK